MSNPAPSVLFGAAGLSPVLVARLPTRSSEVSGAGDKELRPGAARAVGGVPVPLPGHAEARRAGAGLHAPRFQG